MRSHRGNFRSILLASAFVVTWNTTAWAQLGMVTAALGQGEIIRADGSRQPLSVGSMLNTDDTLLTSSGASAMVFFVSGFGSEDIAFQGAIVVEVDQLTQMHIRRGAGRPSPIDLFLTQGRCRAFFDAREHKDYILLSTPLGSLKVLGSIIFASHDTPEQPGSVWGSFDSDCQVILSDSSRYEISSYQKLVAKPQQLPEVISMRSDEVERWGQLPDLNLVSALSIRTGVQSSYAGRSWVGEYVTSAERLEDVAEDRSANIPSQEPGVVSNAQVTSIRTQTTTTRDAQPRLRTSGAGRRAGDEEDGFGRETLRRPTMSQRNRTRP